MALGDYSLFSWKSKAAQQKEQEDYAAWAFPYGEKQRENLQALLFAVFPKESVPTTLIPFLTCKELYETVLKNFGSREKAIDRLINTQKKYKLIIKKKDMTKFIALVLADADIDERCEYPPVEDILAKVQELEDLKRD
jgi:hypothetical protein